MPNWIAHTTGLYPFAVIDDEGRAVDPPTVLVRIKAQDRSTVLEKGNWLPANKWDWKVPRSGPHSGSIIEYMLKG